MAIRVYKPTTPGRRNASVSDFSDLTRSTPEKSLVRKKSKTGGRNSYGRMTSRHRGGGHKRQYRLIDFRRWDKDGVPARVAEIEYDPNRSARIALLNYADGEKRYIIAPEGIKQGDLIETGPKADIKPGNNPPRVRPPCGWSTGFMDSPRVIGRLPSQRARPALPSEMLAWSELPTSPIVARQRASTLRISPDGMRSWA